MSKFRARRTRAALAAGMAGTVVVAGFVTAPVYAAGPHRYGFNQGLNLASSLKPGSNALPSPPAAPAGRPRIPGWATDSLQSLASFGPHSPGGSLGHQWVSAFRAAVNNGTFSRPGGFNGYAGSNLRTRGPLPGRVGAASLSSGGSTSAAIKLSAPGIGTWGKPGAATTLVLYDNSGTYGYLGSMYALAAGNLATHFGQVTAEPVTDYQAGQVNDFTATIYIGSTYNEAIPTSFLTDVASTTHPVIWAGDNIWQMSGTNGSTSDTAFEKLYGWNPSNSYFTSTSAFNQVEYKGQYLTRLDTPGLASPLLDPYMTNPSQVTILANAIADPDVNSGYTSVPWAIRSANLTYIGEVPFSYVNETDRVMAFESILFNALAPTTPNTRRALVRLEDLNAEDSQSQIRAAGALLKKDGIPFSFNIIPQYEDPTGFYNNGIPVSISLPQDPAFIATIHQLLADGGTMVDEGYTHQYSNVPNPYDGVTADDFEFYRAQCAPTDSPPYTFATGNCPTTDYVIEQGPVPGDSAAWATGRIVAAKNEFVAAGLPVPQISEFPHYAASMVDYQAAAKQYSLFYDRRLYYSASLTGKQPNYSYGRVLGQFFPYSVTDVYGSTVIPENLGDYEPNPINHSPARFPADFAHEAALNTVIPDAIASFFYDPSYGTNVLSQIISGIQGEGYHFVSAMAVVNQP